MSQSLECLTPRYDQMTTSVDIYDTDYKYNTLPQDWRRILENAYQYFQVA